MKIAIIQSGTPEDFLLTNSLLIGLHKKHQKAEIIWIGDPKYFYLIKHSKRVNSTVSIKDLNFSCLSSISKISICVNTCPHKEATRFTSLINAKTCYGFDKNGPTNRQAEFFQKVMDNKIRTNKTIQDLYYGMADLKWRREGYGLCYYPRTKQTEKCGKYLSNHSPVAEKCKDIHLPPDLLSQFDTINQYSEIVTDDMFVLHAGLSLRKYVSFLTSPLPYRIDFFKRGKIIEL